MRIRVFGVPFYQEVGADWKSVEKCHFIALLDTGNEQGTQGQLAASGHLDSGLESSQLLTLRVLWMPLIGYSKRFFAKKVLLQTQNMPILPEFLFFMTPSSNRSRSRA